MLQRSKVLKHRRVKMATSQDIIAFNKQNFEAVIQSSKILVEGVQSFARQAVANAQAQYDENIANFKAVIGAKSPREAFELQTAALRANVEKTLTGIARTAEASYKLAQQVAAPIAARVNAANETFAKAA
jgi:phasin family protein